MSLQITRIVKRIGAKYMRQARLELQRIALRNFDDIDDETESEPVDFDTLTAEEQARLTNLAVITVGWLYVSLLGEAPCGRDNLVVTGFMDELYKIIDQDILQGQGHATWASVSASEAQEASACISRLAVRFITECANELASSTAEQSISVLEGGFLRLQRAFALLATVELFDHPANWEEVVQKLDTLVTRYRRGLSRLEVLVPSRN